MYFRSNAVRLWRGHWYGYSFAFIQNETSRRAFLDAFKAALPMKVWDQQSKVWWVPDLYSHIAETVAIEHGALKESQLQDMRRIRGETYESVEQDLTAALGALGLNDDPTLPLNLVKRVMDYWETTLGSIPTQALELEQKRLAYKRVLAQYGENL